MHIKFFQENTLYYLTRSEDREFFKYAYVTTVRVLVTLVWEQL